MQNVAAVESESADTIIANHDSLIRHLAVRFVGSGVSIDDLMQEGRIALWQAEKKWRRESSLWTYARRAVFAAMLRCASEHVAETHEELFEDTVAGVGDNAEVAFLVRECLSMLSEEERVIVKLFMEGETFESIGAALKVSDRNVRRVFQGALSTLREHAGQS